MAVKLSLSPVASGKRFFALRAVDGRGHEAQLLSRDNPYNANPYDARQVSLSLKPDPDARAVRLTFALPRSRFYAFVARPEFVQASTSPSPAAR